MQAYEFSTVVHNGIIRVPEQFAGKNMSWVKVILLSDLTNEVIEPPQKKFTAMRLRTKGFKFNREDEHER